MKPVTKTKNGVTGGVEDLGNFFEGFCFKLNGMVDGNDLTWIVCSHSLFEKE